MLAPLPAEAVRAQLVDVPDDVEVVSVPRDEDPVPYCEGADVCIADWSSHHRVAGPVVTALAPTCRLVQVPAAGLDSVDLDACVAAGLTVSSAAGLNAGAVAEWCVWAALSGLRGLVASDRAMRAGRWEQIGAQVRYELDGKVVGLVGMGDIGVAAAPRFAAFGVDLRYWTRTRRPAETEAQLGVTWSELDDLVAAADVLVLVIALTADTRHLLDASRIARLKPSAVVVNAARGAVTDEAALAEALAGGRVHAVVTDVYSQEPAPDDHPLVAHERSVVTPHIAGASLESVGRILERVMHNVRAVLNGEAPEGVVGAISR